MGELGMNGRRMMSPIPLVMFRESTSRRSEARQDLVYIYAHCIRTLVPTPEVNKNKYQQVRKKSISPLYMAELQPRLNPQLITDLTHPLLILDPLLRIIHTPLPHLVTNAQIQLPCSRTPHFHIVHRLLQHLRLHNPYPPQLRNKIRPNPYLVDTRFPIQSLLQQLCCPHPHTPPEILLAPGRKLMPHPRRDIRDRPCTGGGDDTMRAVIEGDGEGDLGVDF
ncbi:hypothetical protein DFP72DRAFT_171276 [Ephemerocybe angulata]|uniref:Uncharacterized protein n=1 Tax=Ephemerocybe angulata TaxID=980116 RepID=A0A8H6LU12_9AGAR|nr:hypothetical protein DFP72DRAFT_171276 [Tulosesus angulatus]